MLESCTARRLPSTKSPRTDVHLPEQMFGSILGDVARLLWPRKTAAHVAALVGCSERAAEFYLAGEREWSGDAVTALVFEILRRHRERGNS